MSGEVTIRGVPGYTVNGREPERSILLHDAALGWLVDPEALCRAWNKDAGHDPPTPERTLPNGL